MQPIKKMSHGELSILEAAGKRVKLLSGKDLTMTAICINAADGENHVGSLIFDLRSGPRQSPLSAHSPAVRAEIVPTLNGGVHKVRDQENHHERKFHLLQNSP